MPEPNLFDCSEAFPRAALDKEAFVTQLLIKT